MSQAAEGVVDGLLEFISSTHNELRHAADPLSGVRSDFSLLSTNTSRELEMCTIWGTKLNPPVNKLNLSTGENGEKTRREVPRGPNGNKTGFLRVEGERGDVRRDLWNVGVIGSRVRVRCCQLNCPAGSQ